MPQAFNRLATGFLDVHNASRALNCTPAVRGALHATPRAERHQRAARDPVARRLDRTRRAKASFLDAHDAPKALHRTPAVRSALHAAPRAQRHQRSARDPVVVSTGPASTRHLHPRAPKASPSRA